MAKKALLMILDGWGCGDRQKDDVIFNTPTHIGTVCWLTILIHSCRPVVRM